MENYVYMNNTQLLHFEAMKYFDTELRMHLMKYIVQVEEEIRTLVGYKFGQVNKNGYYKWYEVNAYNPNINTQDKAKVISKCFAEIGKSKQSCINHYYEKHKEIPKWIFVKTLNFSTFIDFFEICKNEVKNSICDVYGIKNFSKYKDGYDHRLLISIMHWMRKIRNSCAHNERIYGMIRGGRVLQPFKEFLPDRKMYLRGSINLYALFFT